ncbi:hypothetical protein DC522_29320 [Microvirga sp. KLBC 81]|uniref:hypothetical protein n=1 Tax=Microvirga sp. KLBC 81 TaxID=1862707 RepID=UPI000D50BC45|nr:hypothetical protein [Microvirga sp. KLBC 81]PVE20958.1 hypothetical protein DC522_29320 [Microvirga sp. KLBC 81]
MQPLNVLITVNTEVWPGMAGFNDLCIEHASAVVSRILISPPFTAAGSAGSTCAACAYEAAREKGYDAT